jgi:hypothetical protein
MIEQSSASLCWREGANYLSPVQRILAFGYYDGPTDGVLLCGNAQVFRFDLLAWDEDTQDVRGFRLSPLAREAWEQLVALCCKYETPRWPVWVFWREELRQPIDAILRQAGDVEWVIATEDLLGEMLRVKAIRPEEMVRITDWGAFLELPQELREGRPFLND